VRSLPAGLRDIETHTMHLCIYGWSSFSVTAVVWSLPSWGEPHALPGFLTSPATPTPPRQCESYDTAQEAVSRDAPATTRQESRVRFKSQASESRVRFKSQIQESRVRVKSQIQESDSRVKSQESRVKSVGRGELLSGGRASSVLQCFDKIPFTMAAETDIFKGRL
jgi:hypothetical protein